MQEQPLDFYQQFFTENLYLVPDQTPATTPIPVPISAAEEINGDTVAAKTYRILGENRKGLLIVVSLPESEFAQLPRHDFLTKVLTSIKHLPDDVGFVNLNPQEKLDIYQISKETTLNALLAFGPGLLDMSSDSKIHLYKPASIGKIPLLIADVLTTIENDVNKKKSLWVGLQSIFLK